jgi:hypothetical protein
MGQSDNCYVRLNPAGKLVLQSGNDAHYALRHPRAANKFSESEVTLEELRQFPSLYREALELLGRED